ncbi:hypothetical protein MTO92_10605 [Lentilactobacillus kefiri]|uniref:hypothetical protein n=1 Tax=Lentilactobacillus kefiri TaxID=33962 RepID=UPI001FB257B2|nr:hypothetical protein [Lentilactobacillus kefiri]UOD78089.1 hypothetical protein MTO92_10605 [Lentilactobacillus kefiri]
MKHTLKASLFTGLAALGLTAIVGTSTAKPAAAKLYARTTSNQQLTTDPTTRNVAFTGNNALYTKAGTLHGARVIASGASLSTLAAANTAGSNVRAYRVATTNRGSVYYKVVTFDGQYRGWIYGGTSTGTFGGGITPYATTQDATAPDAKTTFKLTDTALAQTTNNVFYDAPANTQYKVGAAPTINTLANYKDATFTVTIAVTNPRDNTTWYQLASVNGDLNGKWVDKDNLTEAKPANNSTSDNSVTVVYLDGENGTNNPVDKANQTFTTTDTSTKAGQVAASSFVNADKLSLQDFAKKHVPAGYAFVSFGNDNAVFGGTQYVEVKKAAQVKVVYLDATNNNNNPIDKADQTFTAVNADANAGTAVSKYKNSDGLTLADFAKKHILSGYTFKSFVNTDAVFGGTQYVAVVKAK